MKLFYRKSFDGQYLKHIHTHKMRTTIQKTTALLSILVYSNTSANYHASIDIENVLHIHSYF